MPRVLLFGAFADAAGWNERDLVGSTMGDIRAALVKEAPILEDRLSRTGCLVFIEGELFSAARVADAEPVATDAEVGFGPPVSGG